MLVHEIAEWTGLPADDIVLQLWDMGLEYIEGPESAVLRRDRKRVRRAIGLPSQRQLASIEYWEVHLNMSIDSINRLLQRIGHAPLTPRKPLTPAAARTLEEMRRAKVELPPMSVEDPSPPRFEWQQVGKDSDLDFLEYEDVERVHQALVRQAASTDDPISPPGVREESLLRSALERPRTSLGSVNKYPSREMAAAALLHSLIHNHPFHNGNKRTALVSMLCFLDRNGAWMECDQKALFQFVMRVAGHRIVEDEYSNMADAEVMAGAQWVRENTRDSERGERRITGREVRQILRHFECTLEHAKRGNLLLVKRPIEVRTLGIRRTKTLTHHLGYADDGRDISRAQLSDLRRDLHLDAQHGIDTMTFYSKGEPVDSLINEYRQTLDRLARL